MERRQIVVVGGGLAGTATALGFAAAGFDTLLAAPTAPDDKRSSAILGRSLAFLADHGVLDALGEAKAPLAVMRIVDDLGRLFRAPTVEFRASEIGLSAFGINALNEDIAKALQHCTDAEDNLEVRAVAATGLTLGDERAIVTLEDGSEIGADLVVAADGRRSPMREAAGISSRQWRYPQTALVLNIEHARDHASVSTEFHTRTGPFTQVPLPGRRSSLVWVDDPRLAELYVDLKPDRLSSMIAEKLHWILGDVSLDGPIACYPLGGSRVERLTSTRLALVGEAAHAFPPIGAQGLNLGLRDAEALVRLAAETRDDPGSRLTLSRYEAARRGDVASRMAGVDLLNRSLLMDFLPSQIARTGTLAAMGLVGPLRHFAMREGLVPGAGLVGLPRSVKKWMGGNEAGREGGEEQRYRRH
ncbi:UbiH/UbiF family hydroxylase [Aurantimonas sp. 22II-16-19i]|uniref:UbiH/UbiF family hydroxylase n=1 Tax=Aurantimonas sp. 22II-16-19i TaxID=1317114 RepID=UPI0009F7E5F7|nr:UbiH/UbiF family hydroxylase [Aurantimonas sp. 22II-16-19i]ORE98921.1 2-octaprenyl-6-methoxyphenyl hydroxylase [Aurantimonas sp. 22II-16-19i]